MKIEDFAKKKLMEIDRRDFIGLFKKIQVQTHEGAVKKGWWEDDPGEAVAIAGMHSELSEAWDWIRKGNPPSNHIPEFSGVEEEYADEILRIMNESEERGYRVAEAVIAKMGFNETRPYRHGGKKF